uniref:protein SLX4IP isoform X1 n=1 Tax=Podarcis muralis TaxID=64176 RepID=UPI0010A07094|nr:protein SLX4IP isoform X1 [Podarcis muralis]XP_028578064.1 protein SLX4IP isoform X1 [Podarcis muralis]
MLHKLVIKCGNFAVLVDFHVTSRDSSKDTVWFSDRKREDVCLLLKDVVDSRVTQYLKGRKRHGQSKEMEHAKVNPLSLKAGDFHISAYFVKRWTNLQCIMGRKHGELRVFPDRFVVCVTRLDSSPPPQEETLPPGTSEYFGESAATSLTQQEKQEALKKIVKRTKTKKADESKQTSKDTVKVYLGSLHSDRE